MKIMVVSDTHGQIQETVNQYRKLKNIDMIIHLGDYFKDAQRIKDIVDSRMIYVKSNTDGEFSERSRKVIEMKGHKILLTHGHMDKVKSDLLHLYYKTVSLSCDIVLFGHTHIPVNIRDKGILFLNPGSPTIPKGGSYPSFALLDLHSHTVTSEIVSLRRS